MNDRRRTRFSRRRDDLELIERQEEEIASVQEALQNAWLNRYGITRLVRWVVMLMASAFIALFIVDAITTPRDRESCDRRQDIFKVIVGILDGAAEQQQKEADAAKKDLPQSKATYEENVEGARRFRGQAKEIRDNIVAECDKEYNHLPPFNLVLD